MKVVVVIFFSIYFNFVSSNTAKLYENLRKLTGSKSNSDSLTSTEKPSPLLKPSRNFPNGNTSNEKSFKMVLSLFFEFYRSLKMCLKDLSNQCLFLDLGLAKVLSSMILPNHSKNIELGKDFNLSHVMSEDCKHFL